MEGNTTVDDDRATVPVIVFARSLPGADVKPGELVVAGPLQEYEGGESEAGREPALMSSASRGYLLASLRNR